MSIVLAQMLTSFLLGLFYGWTTCTLVCIPFVSLYIIGSDRAARHSILTTTIFNAGRVLTYALMGLLVGFLGQRFYDTIDEGRDGALLLFAIVLVVIGISIVLTRDRRECVDPSKARWFHRYLPKGTVLRAFTMGFFMATIPCGGLLAVLSLSTVMGSPLNGFIAALLFGIGSSLSPLLLVGAGAGWFSNKVDLQAPHIRIWVKRIAGVVMVMIGVGLLIGLLF